MLYTMIGVGDRRYLNFSSSCLFCSLCCNCLGKNAFLQGTAEVVFSRRQDAMAAIKRYNNVQLDGKPMKLELVGTNITAPDAGAGGFPSAGSFGDPSVAPRRCVSTPDLTYVYSILAFPSVSL